MENSPIKVFTRNEVQEKILKSQPEIESLSQWICVLDLPSKFLSYPEGSRIWYKTFSYGELQRWANTSLSAEDRINLALQGIKTEGFEKQDLDLQDYYYICMLRKLSTFKSAEFKLTYECPHCGEIVTSLQDLEKIEFSELENVKELPLKLQMSNEKILEFKPISITDAIRIEKSGLEDNKINRLAIQIRNMTFEESIEYLTNERDIDDMDILDEVDSILNFGNQEISVKCKNCGEIALIPIIGVSALAEPFREPKRSLKDCIISS